MELSKNMKLQQKLYNETIVLLLEETIPINSLSPENIIYKSLSIDNILNTPQTKQ